MPFGIGDPFDGELIDEQCQEKMQVFDVSGADVEEHLGILPGLPGGVGGIQGVVDRFIEKKGHQVGHMHVHIAVNDGIPDRYGQVSHGPESVHIRCDVFGVKDPAVHIAVPV